MKKVLVVDDTKNIRILLTKCLELEGYEVLTANDGQEALELFQSEVFDLAFFDIKMPYLSGTEVLKRIREMGIKIPVIIITAYATIKNAVECTQMGAAAYLQKPFTADKVRSVLNEMSDLEAAESANGNINAEFRRIEGFIEQGLFNKALDRLKNAISIQPANPMVYFLFSKAYQGMGDVENAKRFTALYEALTP